jgi:flavin reductase (DIM6/NTAB) family NADH-FMN oxidoreductase RutF
MLVSVSIGHRRTGPKDSLVNIRGSGAFCVNVVTEDHLHAMNRTSGDYGPEVDEFEVAGLESEDAVTVDAPRVASCPAVLECELFREVDLGEAPNTLVLGRVRWVHLDPALELDGASLFVEPGSLRPVARLGGAQYALLGEIIHLARPD